tara:strand:- start:16301 stop:18760 length:2460 start_codon:yes stop_codon:yes gene_type:complete
MELVFLKAKQRLAKEISNKGTTPYPLTKNFTSEHVQVSKTKKGLQEFLKTLQIQAASGACLHKGLLKRPLKNESRAMMADRVASTELLILDIDGIQMPTSQSPDVRTVAEKIVAQLPECFQDVSYIAQASASLGFKKDKVSMHFFFLLDQPTQPKILKEWFKLLNYETDILSSQLSLSANGQSLSYKLDPSVAENSKIIYIAPPTFKDDIQDPISSDRFVLVERGSVTIDPRPLLVHVNPERVHNLGVQVKDGLRKKLNLPKKTSKLSTVSIGGEAQEVLQNPDKMTIEISRVNEPYVNCNVNGGDSNGYYFVLTNPHYMYNFKGEPVWEIQKADPDFYRNIFEIFADKIDKDKKIKPVALRDFYTDTYYNGIYDETTQQFTNDYPLTPTNKQSIDDFMRSHNRPSLDYIPDARVVFDPSNNKGIELDEAPYYVNLYRKTEYMLKQEEHVSELTYGGAEKLHTITPHIAQLLMHVLGNGKTEFEHFINWLAYIYQNKNKAMTAWIFTGVPGTGKGLFVHKVLKPLFGEQQAPMRALENIEEQFNLYMRTALFLIVDEFRMGDAGSIGKMADKLKHQITEPNLTIRAMRSNQIELPSFCNFLFLTNRADAVKIEEGDRRYNVAPRQEVKLENANADLINNMNKLEQELYIFAGVLNKFQVDQRMAHTALENEAKIQMKNISMSVLEEFAAAVRQRNLEYFTEVLDIPLTNTFDAGGISTAQRYLKYWIAEVGNEIIIPMSQFKLVYDILTDSRNKLSTRDFTKAMSRLNIKTSRKRVSADKNASIPRGVVLTWKLDDNIRNSLIKEHFEDRDNLLLQKTS